ncbi:hypothetical protein L3V82_11855 [Thiotrichales bacterium 19S3-7]|nr:hypothetical protein [Thiotrichales bacterium 19S3-7]MCF6802908.1 hypothetical protein [Thiotrichales bacterium 19S3-11]
MPISKITHRSKEGDRDIVVINGYAFYRSTGRNSHMPGTWLPFLGIGISKVLFNNNKFLKPSGCERLLGDSLMNSNYFSQIFSQNTLVRFGNIETAYMSYCLGGQCWQQAKSDFDSQSDPTLGTIFHHTFIRYFNDQQLDLDQLFEVNDTADFITENNVLVNQWLEAQGAKYFIRDVDSGEGHYLPEADKCNLLAIDFSEIMHSITEHSQPFRIHLIRLSLIAIMDKTLDENDANLEKFQAINYLRSTLDNPNLLEEELVRGLLQFERLVSHKRIGFRSMGFLADSYNNVKEDIIGLRG